jgi:hypothetical protein
MATEKNEVNPTSKSNVFNFGDGTKIGIFSSGDNVTINKTEGCSPSDAEPPKSIPDPAIGDILKFLADIKYLLISSQDGQELESDLPKDLEQVEEVFSYLKTAAESPEPEKLEAESIAEKILSLAHNFAPLMSKAVISFSLEATKSLVSKHPVVIGFTAALKTIQESL